MGVIVAKLFGLRAKPGQTPVAQIGGSVHRDGDYLSIAHAFIPAFFPRGLRYWREGWWTREENNLWRKEEDLDFRAKVYAFAADQRFKRGQKAVPIATSKTSIDFIIDALKAAAELSPDAQFEGIALEDGKIDPVTRIVSPFEPDDFVTWTLPFHSSALGARPMGAARAPKRWESFLAEGSTPDDIRILQEWFGYCLIGNNKLQKTFWLYGPPGCGKSIICQILTMILAPERVAVRSDDTLKSKYNNDLVDKRLIYFSDYRNDARATQQALKFLLTVGGNDPVLIEAKYKSPFTARLGAKILFTSNEMPMFRDTTAAALRRLLISHRHAHTAKEDPNLLLALESEIVDIFAWALDGAKRLIEQGRFSEDALDPKLKHYTARATNATFAFIQDAILVVPSEQASKLDLFAAWRRYAEERGHFQRFNFESFVVSFIQSVKLEHPSIKADESTVYGIAIESRYLNPF